MKKSISNRLLLILLFHGVISPFFRLSHQAVINYASWNIIKHRNYVMQFGTKSAKIRRSVQHCCLSVHNVTFILGNCNTVCGRLDFVQFLVLLFSLWSVGILRRVVGDCDV
jgi:hypothetical protein